MTMGITMHMRIFDHKFSTTTSTKGLQLLRVQIRTRQEPAVKFIKEIVTLWNEISEQDWQTMTDILERTGARLATAKMKEMFDEKR